MTPRAHVQLDDEGHATVTLHDQTHTITADTYNAARAAVVDHLASRAARAGVSVLAETLGPDGRWMIRVRPNGDVEDAEDYELTRVDPMAPNPMLRSHSGPESPVSAPTPPEPADHNAPPPVDSPPATTEDEPPVDSIEEPTGSVDEDQPEEAEAAAPDLDQAHDVEDDEIPEAADGGLEEPENSDGDHLVDATPATGMTPNWQDRLSGNWEPPSTPTRHLLPHVHHPRTSVEEHRPAVSAPAPPAVPITPDYLARTAHTLEQRQEPQQPCRFVTTTAPEGPATTGVRGALSRIGIRMRPGRREQQLRNDVDAVSRHWAGPRTIAVVNAKGGSGKTPTSIMLSAVLARHGGAGVLAWDNNQTRGTLGWRTQQGNHDATIHDLLHAAPQTSADMTRFVHHQVADKFDVLRSQPMALAEDQRLTGEHVDVLHTLVSRFYRVIVMDSGNDESDPMWRRMIDHADQVVLATTHREDHAEAGALLLDQLRRGGRHAAQLAHQAVVVISQADPATKSAELHSAAATFRRQLNVKTATIPYDGALVSGPIEHDRLRPATQRAWLAAAATVARQM